MKHSKFPSLFQINTRVWLTELSRDLGRKATLDDIPDNALDELEKAGFDWIWFLSVWRTGEKARKISIENIEWRREFKQTLPDLCDNDIAGSGFAIMDYTVHPDLGGEASLSRLRSRLQKRNLKLMLDFVPNHMAPDHRWVKEHPDYFVPGTSEDLVRNPKHYTVIKQDDGDRVMALGRDPFFPGWPDTLQLDYSNPDTQEAMIKELLRIAVQCDGLRCDMAMLILPEVFEKTWGRKPASFWPAATGIIRQKFPDFCFMAEVYWDLEWTLQQQGFDYTYDKRLYDRLRDEYSTAVREHFYAEPAYQVRLARFLENHDEPRAAATFEWNKHKAAAIVSFLCQGLRFFHQGQFEGRKTRISPHLIRAPGEPVNLDIKRFYSELLTILRKPLFRNGKWRLLTCSPAWEGNGSSDSFLAFAWELDNTELSLVVINYAAHTSQCYIRLPFRSLAGGLVRFTDMINPVVYDRLGDDVLSKGIYIDMPAWGYHVFQVTVPARPEGLDLLSKSKISSVTYEQANSLSN